MPPPVPTNTRSGRRIRLAARFQGAEGTPQTSFASGTGAVSFRTEEVAIDVGLPFAEPEWMMELAGEDSESEHDLGDEPADLFIAQATPGALEMLLTSNWGPAVAGVFSLESQVTAARWLTLGWHEDRLTPPAAVKRARMQDAWIHRLSLIAEGPRGPILAVAEYAGSKILIDSYAVAPSLAATDDNVFAVQRSEIIRDPAGDNESIRFSRWALVFDQNLIGGKSEADWDMMRQRADVVKGGKADVSVSFRGEVNDESWELLTDARALVKQTFRITATAPTPAKTLTVDLAGAVAKFRPTGHVARGFREFEAVIHARVISGAFVDLSII